MSERLRKIGQVKATEFKKSFDKVYDYWKDKAEFELGYGGELRFIKEHNLVFIYIILPELDNLEQIDPKNYHQTDEESEELDD
jgi:hypothetical protein